MTSLYQAMLSQAAIGHMLSVRDVSKFSAAEIRQTMADLVAADQIPLANALAVHGGALRDEAETSGSVGWRPSRKRSAARRRAT